MTTTSESPLLRMTQTTPTCLWNDSADPVELSQAIGWGAVGATCNPVIALAASALFEGWQATPLALGGMALCLLSVWAAQRSGPSKP